MIQLHPIAQRQEIAELERKLQEKKNALAHVERTCAHKWGETQPDHIYREGYMDPGDPPGTMGIDWRGPVYVPSKTTYRWKRVCFLCGKTEHTSQTTKEVTLKPSFG